MAYPSAITDVLSQYQHQPTFLQAAHEWLESVVPMLREAGATDGGLARVARLMLPERVITFKVLWEDDAGTLQHNVGYRVQFNSALGPYKGGLRFDPSVNEDVLKFLAFEQIFKNALTGLPLGGGKGGSDFNPKGKSETEIRRFCRAFMIGLYQHIGIDVDVPAGDMGVGGREIGYLYGMYKELTHRNEGVLTGKNELFGGSCRRTEATGHGVVYFAEAMRRAQGETLAGLTAVVSGSGNVAEHTARQLLASGAVVLTLSDRGGYIHKSTGLTIADIDTVCTAKQTGKSLAEVTVPDASYTSGTPWQAVPAAAYFPCATQNEITFADAQVIAEHAQLVVEGANMPVSDAAARYLREQQIPFAPGKAANAGGVTVSAFEMAQNASHFPWTCEQVERELKRVMQHIHDQCATAGRRDGHVDYVHGANVAGAKRVLSAMEKLGW